MIEKSTLEILLLIGGMLHFGILIASALTPGVLDWRNELGRLSALSRHLVWVHGVFIVLVIIAFGCIATFNAGELATGARLARWVSGIIATFWLARLGIQFFLFDPRPYLKEVLFKVGYHGLTVVFAYLALVFGLAAIGS